jgi:hypothetical protein
MAREPVRSALDEFSTVALDEPVVGGMRASTSQGAPPSAHCLARSCARAQYFGMR